MEGGGGTTGRRQWAVGLSPPWFRGWEGDGGQGLGAGVGRRWWEERGGAQRAGKYGCLRCRVSLLVRRQIVHTSEVQLPPLPGQRPGAATGSPYERGPAAAAAGPVARRGGR